MSIKPAKVQFNGGELSPWLEGRTDIAKYDKTAKLCRNFIPLAEGSLKRRGGTRFVAATPEGDSILFKIVPDPEEAEVYINGVKRREVYLARGDEVSYRVSCEGYVTVVDTLTADADEELAVRLVAKGIMCELTVETVPADAVVELNGYERRSLRINKNGEVFYRVAKENYITQEGTIIADMTKTVTIELVKEKEYDYGDWGDVVGLAACTAVGRSDREERCFYIKFSNGFLPVVFVREDMAPTGNLDESLFEYTDSEKLNSIALQDGAVVHTRLVETKGEMNQGNYYDADDTLVLSVDAEFIEKNGWQKDETQENYGFFYDAYTGKAERNILSVYRGEELVWELRGRNNG